MIELKVRPLKTRIKQGRTQYNTSKRESQQKLQTEAAQEQEYKGWIIRINNKNSNDKRNKENEQRVVKKLKTLLDHKKYTKV